MRTRTHTHTQNKTITTQNAVYQNSLVMLLKSFIELKINYGIKKQTNKKPT